MTSGSAPASTTHHMTDNAKSKVVSSHGEKVTSRRGAADRHRQELPRWQNWFVTPERFLRDLCAIRPPANKRSP